MAQLGPLWLSLPWLAGLSLSFPLEARNLEPIYAYVPDPPGRGTIGLVYTCLLTLALCLWTAMHPDVPFCRDSWLYGFAHKTTWMVLAIILPEFVVCCAASQFLEARALHKAWEAYWLDRGDLKKQKWFGREGAFLVVMGGYEIACSGSRSPPTSPPMDPPMDKDSAQKTQCTEATPPTPPISCPCKAGIMDRGQPVRRTLTPAGLRKLLALQGGSSFSNIVESGVLDQTHFDPRHVQDKGKANYAAKLLTTAQILWTVLQWIARKVGGLPITLLEVHVLIQIPYTLIAYFFWWSKPLDVGMPIVLPICHLLPSADGAGSDEWRLSESQSCFELDGRDSGPSRHQQPVRARRASSSLFSVVSRSGYDFAWHFDGRAELGAALMAVLNGCLHATAWVSHFPTPVERFIWRAACVGVGLGPVAICAVVWGRELECRALQYIYRLATRDVTALSEFGNVTAAMWALVVCPPSDETRDAGNEDSLRIKGLPVVWPIWCRHLVVAALAALMVMYLASILYFVIEAFVSLRSIPGSAYETVAWTNYLPHF